MTHNHHGKFHNVWPKLSGATFRLMEDNIQDNFKVNALSAEKALEWISTEVNLPGTQPVFAF